MNAFLPYRRSSAALVYLVFVDAAILLAALVAGVWFGFGHVYRAVTEWRLAHPLSFLPSVAVAVVLARRWRA